MWPVTPVWLIPSLPRRSSRHRPHKRRCPAVEWAWAEAVAAGVARAWPAGWAEAWDEAVDKAEGVVEEGRVGSATAAVAWYRQRK